MNRSESIANLAKALAGRRGQPTRRFKLSTVSTVYGNTYFSKENTNIVDVDDVDTPTTEAPVGKRPTVYSGTRRQPAPRRLPNEPEKLLLGETS